MSVSPFVELCSVGKSFGPTRALDGVDLELYAGEVHVVAGENGAGKSTLIRILCGVHSDFDGRMRIDGVERRFANPAEAATLGIVPIHQELSLIGPMSVTDNLLLGEAGPLLAPLSAKRRRQEAQHRLSALGIEVDPDRAVETLPLAERQLVEIARALARRPRLLVMDEPTSALPEREAERLFERVRALADQDNAVLYISHRMEEIFRLADRITVLRDGRRVLTAPANELGPAELVRAMIGRELKSVARFEASGAAEALLRAEEVVLPDPRGGGRRVLDGVSLSVGQGEVVGLAGLQGSGASELLLALAGAGGGYVGGSVVVEGRPLPLGDLRSALACGVVYLPSDRRSSVFPKMSIVENATLSSLAHFTRFGFVDLHREREQTEKLKSELRLATPSLDAPARSLSGGNQQKLALLRCLLAEPKLLLLDEPTRGIDVGSKADLYATIAAIARRKIGILFVASEMEELLALSDRIVVLFRGRVVDTIERGSFTRERILGAAMGGDQAA